MSLFIASLNSGSNGNCYYIGNDQEAVFIDAGLSCKETELRMHRLGLDMHLVKAIFISHEHSDHISGVVGLVTKYKIPVYFSQPTLKEAGLGRIRKHALYFTAHQNIMIGGLHITAFPKKHDACDPHSFIVSGFIISNNAMLHSWSRIMMKACWRRADIRTSSKTGFVEARGTCRTARHCIFISITGQLS
jgi:phosphoribosyl 1,2-cyclic phosphodiesterase